MTPTSDQNTARRWDPAKARAFAIEVVQRLRAAGFQAVWAGGCVRDQLLRLPPKDYDVATSATPEQVRAVFGQQRTLAIGQSFGVIVVLGPRGAGQIDVATFRRDATYSDGRHPDAVAFSTAEEDAQRRDFTVNGLFFDPLENRVLDFVGGQTDLQRRLIRAIGDPHARFAEDKLRMLRAVRFAATFDFAIDRATLEAVRQHARELAVVSAERIAVELRRMLVDRRRRRAAELLRETTLLPVILPEIEQLEPGLTSRGGDPPVAVPSPPAWEASLAILERLREPTFAVALAALLRPCILPFGPVAPPTPNTEHPPLLSSPEHRTLSTVPPPLPSAPERRTRNTEHFLRVAVERISQRLKLTVAERKGIEWLLTQEQLVRGARQVPWPRLQRILVHEGVEELLCYARAVAAVVDGSEAEIDYCQQKRSLPPEELDPPPLITGDDLKSAGLRPGPEFARILEAVRDAQLERQLNSPAAALAFARQLCARGPGGQVADGDGPGPAG